MFYAALTSLCITVFASATVLAETAAQIDAVVLDEMARQNIVGMAVGIVKNGRIYYAKGYGYTDLARTQPVTTDTIFRWGSISKTLTATAALKLAEESPDFNLNDKVTGHVSYWPKHGNKGNIRIKHLLSNRSGIIHYRNTKNCPGNRYPDYDRNRHDSKTYNARKSVEVFKDQKLCFDPGTRYKYSTFGYSLLAAVIEGASGTSYTSWVNDRIRSPLGMSSLRQATGTSMGYELKGHIMHEIVSGNASWKLPGGGWESSIIDLAKFASALLQGRLLNDTSRLWKTVDDNPRYGFGTQYSPGKRIVGHLGKHNNSRTLLYLYPRSPDRLGIVIMTNSLNSKPMHIANSLAYLFDSPVQ
ncbi:MAG: serine hydrolase domain-containing protein [Gammaproteobacteria bacterium]|jgi:CubicO group peptidase (beta-lactamase class C family)